MADGGSDLTRLVETEHQLDGELVAARAQALQLVSDARVQIAAREQGLADAVRAEAEAARQAVERELEGRLASIDAESRRAASAFDQVTPDRVEALARALVARLVTLEAAP